MSSKFHDKILLVTINQRYEFFKSVLTILSVLVFIAIYFFDLKDESFNNRLLILLICFILCLVGVIGSYRVHEAFLLKIIEQKLSKDESIREWKEISRDCYGFIIFLIIVIALTLIFFGLEGY